MEDNPIAPKLIGILEDFFKEEELKCYNAFKKLPLNPSVTDVQQLKANTFALERLRNTLAIYAEKRARVLIDSDIEAEADKMRGVQI